MVAGALETSSGPANLEREHPMAPNDPPAVVVTTD